MHIMRCSQRCFADRRRKGQVTAFVAISLVGLLGVATLAIDGGLLFANRRAVQNAADAAALAAAIEMYNAWPSQQGRDTNGKAAKSAKDTAKDNGYTDGANGVTVTVNIPPQSGNSVGRAGCAEVIITMQQDRAFSRIFGSGKLTVQGRAVARGSQGSPGLGILILNAGSSNVLQMSGSGSVNVTGGSVVVNSTSTGGLHLSASGSLTAETINTSSPSAPGYSATAGGTVNGDVNYKQQPTPDPLATFAANNTPSTVGIPQYGSITVQSPTYNSSDQSKNDLKDSGGNKYGVVTGPKAVTLFPGYYNGNFTINHNVNDGFVLTLQSGVYIFNGNITLNGYGSINSGTGGTMLYIKSGAFTNSSQNVVLSLSPMTSGTYANPPIAIWQDKADSSQFNSSAGGNLNMTTGIIYIPNTSAIFRLSASAGTTAQVGSQIIAGQMSLTNSGAINVNAGSSGAPGRNLYLTE